jgi:processive 1,2-diacylglycerol beta-glucosyltransferase
MGQVTRTRPRAFWQPRLWPDWISHVTRRRPGLSRELAIVALLLVAYDWVAGQVDVQISSAVARAESLLSLERSLHIAFELRLDQSLTGHVLLGQLTAIYYDFGHIMVTLAVLTVLYVFRPGNYLHARRALVTMNLLALVVYVIAPLAPPRLLPGGGFVDVVARSGTWGAWEGSSTLAPRANQYGSMPSLHVAWAVWVLLVVCALTRRRWLRALAVGHVLVTVAVVLFTGNHYVLDVVAGALVALAAWVLIPRGDPPAPVRPGGVLVVSASMGAGHDGVAYELARRWSEQGTPVTVVDYLRVLPLGMGRVIRRVYAAQLQYAPSTYEWLYGVLDRRPRLDRIAGMIAGTGRRRLLRLAKDGRYRLVVTTYPLAGRAAGQLRREGRLRVPVATFLTDIDVHATWLDRGTDLYVAVYEGSALAAAARTGRPAVATGPVLSPQHDSLVTLTERETARESLQLQGATGPVVLMVTGSWGVGAVQSAARALSDSGAVPVVLCGRNHALRVTLEENGIRALGWTTDVRPLYAAADIVVHNAGGLSCLEAFAAGVPVIGHACLPGHGQRNARAMADADVAGLADDEADLVRLVHEIGGTAAGIAMAGRARGLFQADATDALRDVTPAAGLPARSRRPLVRGAAMLSVVPLVFALTSFGVSEATEKGFGVARPPHSASGEVYLAVLLDQTSVADPSTAGMLVAAGASAVVPAEVALADPDSVHALALHGVSVLGAFPHLPRTPGPARRACTDARDQVVRAANHSVPSLVSLHGLGAWSLSSAYRAHLPVGVAKPLRSLHDLDLSPGEQVAVDVPDGQLAATLAALNTAAASAHLHVRPLVVLWKQQ